MYKAVIFDLDNTLLNYSLCELDSMKKTLRDHNLFVDEGRKWDEFWQSFLKHNAKHWLDFVNKSGMHRSIQDVLHSSFRDALNMNPSDHDMLTHTYWDYFCNTCIYEEGAQEVLQSIKPRYKLGIISNGIGMAQRKRLAVGDLFHFFESIVVSDEVGIRKPEKKIFDIALDELQLSSHEVLFVGDSLTDDYQGARNAGIDFCYYNRNGHSISIEYQPKYIVRELKELLGVV